MKIDDKWRGRLMTPTAFGIVSLLIAGLVGLWKSSWRPWLELCLFFFGVTVGFGGLGIALRNHVSESGKQWGWVGLASHWPSFDTWESIFWHGVPALLAVLIAGHWFREARKCRRSVP